MQVQERRTVVHTDNLVLSILLFIANVVAIVNQILIRHYLREDKRYWDAVNKDRQEQER